MEQRWLRQFLKPYHCCHGRKLRHQGHIAVSVYRTRCDENMYKTVVFHLSCAMSSPPWHYNDVKMGAIASQITSLTIVYSIVYSDQRKHQSSASLASASRTGEFPAQMASNAENVSISWRHRGPGRGESARWGVTIWATRSPPLVVRKFPVHVYKYTCTHNALKPADVCLRSVAIS